MEKQSISIDYNTYKNYKDLPEDFQRLWDQAFEARKQSHSPYSNFTVGCAIEIEDGEIITGTNQENAAFPAGLCAERTAMYRSGIQARDKKFKKLAICATRAGSEILESAPPCGGCRQVMLEFKKRHSSGFQLLFTNAKGEFVVINDPEDLFPFSFVF